MPQDGAAGAMLEVEGIETFYGASQALFGMSLTVNPGEMVTLIGRNGMGKTTTVHSILGITPVAKGSIVFKGERVEALPSFAIAQRGIGFVPEGRQVFPNLSLEENLIATAANRTGRSDPWTLETVLQLFPALAERRRSMGNLLSGGEQQMLAIGRALMTNPDLLVLDEATEGLAPLIRSEIWRVLGELKAKGQSILVIDKNVPDLARIADRHYVVQKGQVVWSGNSQKLLEDEDLLARYLGV